MAFRYFLGYLAYLLTKVWSWTLSYHIEFHPNYDASKPYLFAFWHGKQFLMILNFGRHETKKAALASPSKDGDIVAAWLKKMGYDVIRGSSRRNNVAALAKMIKKIKQGYSMGIAIDGPLGPIYKVKAGTTHLAQKYGIEIIPLGSALNKKWVFEKSWDHFELPKPFSKTFIYVGDPMTVDQNANLDESNQLLEARINEAECNASALMNKKIS